MLGFGVHIESKDLARAVAKLRHEADGKQLRRDTLKELRGAARPAQFEVRNVARGLDAKGPVDGGFRKDMAAAVGTKVRLTGDQAGVSIRLARGRLKDRAGIARYSNRPGWWRHPVMGDRDTWVRQNPGWTGWFDRTLSKRRPEVRRAVKKVLDDLEHRLARR